jgi:hypothetical protein
MEIMKLSPDAKAKGFTQDLGIDIYEGTQGMGRVGTRLVTLDRSGSATLHITDELGADYYIACVNYQRKQEIKGKRTIAVIMPGYHTKFAYWPQNAKPRKISIHSGTGYLIVGDPKDEELDGDFKTRYYSVDAEVTPSVTLQPGNFYTLEAAPGSTLTVSSLAEIDDQGNWDGHEIPVEPGQQIIKAPEGIIPVPDEFVYGEIN